MTKKVERKIIFVEDPIMKAFHKKHTQLRPPGVQAAAIYAVYINVLIYLLFLIMLVYGRNAIIPSEGEPPPHPPMSGWMLLYGAFTTYAYVFLLFCLNFYILRRNNLSGTGKLAVSLLLSFVYVVLWNKLFLFLQTQLFDLPPPDSLAIRGSLVRDVVLGGLVVFTSQLMNSNYRRQQIALENEALKAEYERARYETLKNQIDPHFLFNTFNTLNSIVGKDPQKGQQYIQKLSSIFRYTLQGKDITTLEEELSFTKDYCALMQIRYGDNLDFVFDIGEGYLSYSIAPFSIQTLVENAIKHNVITDRQKLTVTLSTEDDGYLTVSNPVAPKKEHEGGEGIGLANLSERYRLKWGKDIVINNDGQTFRVRIPLISPIQLTNNNG